MLLTAYFTLVFCLITFCRGFEIFECISAIKDLHRRDVSIQRYGLHDVFLFDDSSRLIIKGSGFELIANNKPSIKLSGQAVQHRDFEVSVSNSTIVLTLNPRSRWVEYFTQSPYQPLFVESVTFEDMPESNLISKPVVVAFITEHPKIFPRQDLYVINSTGHLVLTGKGLMGHESMDFQFLPPLTAGVDFEIESRFPLLENQVVLRSLPGHFWRQSSGPLYIAEVNVPKVLTESHSLHAKAVVAIVQSGEYVSHNVEVTTFNEDDMTIYHDQVRVTLQGINLKPPFEFSNGMQNRVNYTVTSIRSDEVVLRLNKNSTWGNSWNKYPQKLRLLSAATSNHVSPVALGEKGLGIVVAVVFRRPTVTQSFTIPVIQQSNTKVIYIEGSGFVTETHLSFVPTMPPDSYSITVMSNNLLEVALKPGFVWKGLSNQIGLGYLYVKGVSSRGDAGWNSLAPSPYHSNGILIGNIVADIVNYGHVMPATTADTIDNTHYILEGKPSSMLPIDDPFEWTNVDLPYGLTTASVKDVCIIGVKNPMIVIIIDDNDDINDGIFYRNVVLSSTDKTVGGMSWIRSHIELQSSDKAVGVVGRISTSISGKYIAATFPGRAGLFISFMYGQYWEHRALPMSSTAFLRGSAPVIVNEVAMSDHGSLLAVICSRNSEGLGGQLYLSENFGSKWSPIPFVNSAGEAVNVASIALGGDGTFIIASLLDSAGESRIARSWSSGVSWDVIATSGFVCRQLLFASPMNSEHKSSSLNDEVNAATLSSLNVLCVDKSGHLWHSDSFGVSWKLAGGMSVDGEEFSSESRDCKWGRVSSGQLGGYISATVSCVKNSARVEYICISVNMGRTFSPLTNAPGSLSDSLISLSVSSDHLIVGAHSGMYVGSVDEAEGIDSFDDAVKGFVEPKNRNITLSGFHHNSSSSFEDGMNFTISKNRLIHPLTHKRFYYQEPTMLYSKSVSLSYEFIVRRSKIPCQVSMVYSVLASSFACLSHDSSFLISSTLGRKWNLHRLDGFGVGGASAPLAFKWLSASESMSTLTGCISSASLSGDISCALFTSADSGRTWQKATEVLEVFAHKTSMSAQFQIASVGWEPDLEQRLRNMPQESVAFASFSEVQTMDEYNMQLESIGVRAYNFSKPLPIINDRVKSESATNHRKFRILVSNDSGKSFSISLLKYGSLGNSFTNAEQLKSTSIAISDQGTWAYVAIPFVGIIMTTDLGMDGWKDALVAGLRWRDISCSNNGKYVAAGFGHSRRSSIETHSDGGVFVSSNYGSTWEMAASPNTWFEKVLVLGNGMHMLAVGINCDDNVFISCDRFGAKSAGIVYQSDSFGQNWTVASRLHRPLGIGTSYLSATPSGDKAIVFSKDGQVIVGSLIETLAIQNIVVYPFHFNLHMSQIQKSEIVFHVFGSGFKDKKISLVFASNLVEKITIQTIVVSDTEINLKLSRAPSSFATATDDLTAATYRLISISYESDGMTQSQEIRTDGLLTMLPEPVVSPGNTILYVNSVRELVIYGHGFIGPVCMVYLDPAPFGVFDCVILSNVMILVKLRDDAKGYSDSLGWLGVLYKWNFGGDHMPLVVTHINFGAGKIPVGTRVAYIHQSLSGGVASLKHYVDLPGYWDQAQFMTNASLFLGLDRTNNVMYKSANGKDKWERVALPNSTIPYKFAASSAGKLVYLTSGSEVHRSYNTGLIWKSVYAVVGGILRDIICNEAGKLVVVATSTGGTLVSSSYGGSWARSADPSFIHSAVGGLILYRELFFSETNTTFYAIAEYFDSIENQFAGRFVVSRDLAKSWSLSSPSLSHMNVSTYHCSESAQVIAVVTRHRDVGLLVSTDFGSQWRAVAFMLSSLDAVAVSRSGDVIVVAGVDYDSELSVQITYTLGNSWSRFQPVNSGESDSPTSVFFAFDYLSKNFNMIARGYNSSELFVGTSVGNEYLQLIY